MKSRSHCWIEPNLVVVHRNYRTILNLKQKNLYYGHQRNVG